jgi:hypothetical protein
LGEFADFVVSALEILSAKQCFGLGEDRFDFFTERVGDEVVHDVTRRVVNASFLRSSSVSSMTMRPAFCESRCARNFSQTAPITSDDMRLKS